jgi:hypothetical protein
MKKIPINYFCGIHRKSWVSLAQNPNYDSKILVKGNKLPLFSPNNGREKGVGGISEGSNDLLATPLRAQAPFQQASYTHPTRL